MIKKTIQAFESLNSNVRVTIQAQFTILGQDQQETDAENRASTNLASQLTNPLEMVKKTIQDFESLNFEVRDKSQVEITMFGQDEQETDTKIRTSMNSASELTNPLEIVKNQLRL